MPGAQACQRRGEWDGSPWRLEKKKKTSGSLPMSQDTVTKAMMRARATFTTNRKDVKKECITSHSLRHRWINDAKTCGIPKEVAMKYALIKDEMTYDKVYGKPTMQQAGEFISKPKCSQKQQKRNEDPASPWRPSLSGQAIAASPWRPGCHHAHVQPRPMPCRGNRPCFLRFSSGCARCVFFFRAVCG